METKHPIKRQDGQLTIHCKAQPAEDLVYFRNRKRSGCPHLIFILRYICHVVMRQTKDIDICIGYQIFDNKKAAYNLNSTKNEIKNKNIEEV